jgi:putative transposase
MCSNVLNYVCHEHIITRQGGLASWRRRQDIAALGRTLVTIAGENNEIEPVSGPKPRKRLRGRIKRMQRRISLPKHRTKKAGIKASRRQYCGQLRRSKLHARLAIIRQDAAHTLTTDLMRRLETIVIEDLNGSGMARTHSNHSLAGAVLDCGFYEIRRQLQDKATMRGGCILVADRFYPSTQICWCCGCLTGPKGREGLFIERWVCGECGAEHERDANAAINLTRPGTAGAESTCGDIGPRPACAGVSASAVDEPQTSTVLPFEHI